jgi:hypothetical protein
MRPGLAAGRLLSMGTQLAPPQALLSQRGRVLRRG